MWSPPGGAEPLSQTRVLPVPDASHIGEARRGVAALSGRLGLDESAAGRVAVVATELATNLATHGGGGVLLVRAIEQGTGVELIAVDRGRGIDDLTRAMRDGYSSSGTPGKGLGAVQRMSDIFDVFSQPSHGTAVLSRMRNLSATPPTPAPEDRLDIGVVCVPAPNETLAGDAWCVTQGDRGPLITVIDGLGHGPMAHEAAVVGLDLARRNQGLTAGGLLDVLHTGMRSTRGAAVGIAELDLDHQRVRFAGIGNVSCGVASSGGNKSLASMNGIVGHEARNVQEFSAEFPAAAALVMFSDGITTRWRLDQYAGLRPRHPALGAAVIHRDHLRGRDDATILIARVAREQTMPAASS